MYMNKYYNKQYLEKYNYIVDIRLNPCRNKAKDTI